jgi:hypothetical protein
MDRAKSINVVTKEKKYWPCGCVSPIRIGTAIFTDSLNQAHNDELILLIAVLIAHQRFS